MLNESEFINSVSELNSLIFDIKEKKELASIYIFKSYKLLEKFCRKLGVSEEEFYRKRFFYDEGQNLHISLCEKEKGLWISTLGLICYKQDSYYCKNKYFESFHNQKVVVFLLIKEVRELLNRDETFDMTGGRYDYLNEIARAFFHNLLFLYELIGKSYLLFCDMDIPRTHKLSKIINLVKKTMFIKKHNDTPFHLHVVYELQQLVNHINKMPPNFKEEYVKYEDNENDQTVIIFNKIALDQWEDNINSMEGVMELLLRSFDNVNSMLTQGMYNRLVAKAIDEEDKKKREEFYRFLIDESL